MVFDGYDFEALLRVNPTRRLAPPVTDQTVEVPGRPGAVFMRQQINPLAIPVHAELRGRMRDHRDLAALRRLISSLLVRDEPCRLILPDEPGLSYDAKLTDPGELDTLWVTGEADLTFTAYDPIAYGQARKATLASGTTHVETGGTWPSSPVLTLTATGSGYVRVTDVDSGDYVLLAQSAASGATVTIDMAAQTAKVNGSLAAVDTSSDFFDLDPDGASVKVQYASGSMEWEERWL